MDDNMMNTVEIAVLKEQMAGLREQQKAHAIASETRSNELATAIKGLQKDVGEVVGLLNRGKGAWAMLLVLSGVVGGIVVKIGTLIIQALGPKI